MLMHTGSYCVYADDLKAALHYGTQHAHMTMFCL
jgi:hypothetical protein